MDRDVVGVILAAGRGSRMRELTREHPKCLLRLAGRPLLFWQLDALRAAGVRRILVVRGYLREQLDPTALGLAPDAFETVDNPHWDQSNMVRTLLCAFPLLGEADALVSYSDIVYAPSHVRALRASQGEIGITYDVRWEGLWRLRNGNPLDDAETFKAREGRLLEIGGRPQRLEDVQGQYMGLLKLSPGGREQIRSHVDGLPAAAADRLDMTALLRDLLAKHVEVSAVAVSGMWCECDTREDIRRYELAKAGGGWEHDWSAGWSSGS